MTILTGTGLGNTSIQSIFTSGTALFQATGDTSFTVTNQNTLASVTVNGSGFTYTSTVIAGTTYYQLTAGTITSVSYTDNNHGPSSQTWTGLNVSAATAFNDLLDQTAFPNDFFSGDDIFNWTAANSTAGLPGLYGYGGNDTFNVGDWDHALGNYRIDGGIGTDTLHLTGGVTSNFDFNYNLSSLTHLFANQGYSNFYVTNVETITLGAGYDYALQVATGFVTSGQTVTVDGSALGASNHLIFSTATAFPTAITSGNLNLIGGAGDDALQGSGGVTTYNGGAGNDTAAFTPSQQSPSGGITANLSIAGLQNFGTGWGSGTFISIENLIGSGLNDTLTGNASDNFLYGIQGTDTLDGGAGNDTAVFRNARSAYTFSYAGHTVTVTDSNFGGTTATLTNIENAQFSDQTIQLFAPIVTTTNQRVAASQTFSMASLFTANNPDGDPITEYMLWDGTPDPNSGHFVLNGVVQASNTVIDITAAQLSQLTFVTGTVSDNIQVRTAAGTWWSAQYNDPWAPFTFGPTTDRAPSVLTNNRSANHFSQIAMYQMVSLGDADGDPIIEYQLYDGTSDPNSGHWVVNNVVQAAGTVIDLTPTQFAQTHFVAGSVGDNLQMRAYDGFQWSAPDAGPWSPFTISVPPNSAPYLYSSTQVGRPGQSISLQLMINTSAVGDADNDPLTRYQLYDATNAPNSGYWVINGVVQSANMTLDVSGVQIAQTSFVVGSVADNLQMRVWDGYTWSAADTAPWAPFTVNPLPDNKPFVVTTSTVVGKNQSIAFSNSIVDIFDPDGDPITAYQIYDATSSPASGHFVVNGVAQAAGQTITLTPAQWAQTSFMTGTVSDNLQIRAFDGQLWSAADTANWSPFTLSVPANLPPVMSPQNLAGPANSALPFASLVNVSDPDGDTITRYQLYDVTNGAGSGFFVVNGQVQAAGTTIDITAAQAAQTFFVVGTIAGDQLQIRAFDGQAWSDADTAPWAPFNVGPTSNSPPVVSTSNITRSRGQTVTGASLFGVTDADGDTITQYQLLDSTTDPNSGHFVVNGSVKAAGTVFTISAAQLAQTTFVTGTVADALQVRAFDGTSWSAADVVPWSPFTLAVTNTAPVLTTNPVTSAGNRTLALSSLITVSDADGDAITRYQLRDNSTGATSGHFVVNNVVQAAGTVIDITAAQAAQTSFITGSAGDNLEIRAFDGNAWSAADVGPWAPFAVSITVNHAPSLTTFDRTLAAGQSMTLANLITVNDVDADTMTRYQLYDATGNPASGHFMVNGVIQPSNITLDITAAQAALTTFVGGTVADNIQIRAYDGQAWSAADTANWAPFVISPPVNHAPVVTTGTVTALRGQTIALSNLIAVSDPDADTITRYQLYDNSSDPNSGHFVVNGQVQAARTTIDLTAAQAAQTSFVTGKVNDDLQIRAFDGIAWSAADTANWAPFTVTVPPNHAPVVTSTDMRVSAGQTIALSSLISISDADGDTMTRYQLYDNTSDPNSGHFTVNGQVQSARMTLDLTAAQAAQTSFVTGTVNDDLQIRVFDGLAWSAADTANWAPFTIGPAVNHAPALTTADTRVAAGQTVSLASLLSISDADGDSMTRYQLYDNTNDPNSGHFTVNGVTQLARMTLDLTAAQAAQTNFVTGTVNDDLQIRVFDGKVWSAADTANWAPFTIGPTVNHAPVVTTGTVNTTPGQTLALSSLISVSDADSDTMTRYQLWDDTNAPNSGHFVVNGVTQGARTVIDITASQLNQTSFVTGALGDALQIRAFDGKAWSAADSAVWAPFQVNVS